MKHTAPGVNNFLKWVMVTVAGEVHCVHGTVLSACEYMQRFL